MPTKKKKTGPSKTLKISTSAKNPGHVTKANVQKYTSELKLLLPNANIKDLREHGFIIKGANNKTFKAGSITLKSLEKKLKAGDVTIELIGKNQTHTSIGDYRKFVSSGGSVSKKKGQDTTSSTESFRKSLKKLSKSKQDSKSSKSDKESKVSIKDSFKKGKTKKKPAKRSTDDLVSSVTSQPEASQPKRILRVGYLQTQINLIKTDDPKIKKELQNLSKELNKADLIEDSADSSRAVLRFFSALGIDRANLSHSGYRDTFDTLYGKQDDLNEVKRSALKLLTISELIRDIAKGVEHDDNHGTILDESAGFASVDVSDEQGADDEKDEKEGKDTTTKTKDDDLSSSSVVMRDAPSTVKKAKISDTPMATTEKKKKTRRKKERKIRDLVFEEFSPIQSFDSPQFDSDVKHSDRKHSDSKHKPKFPLLDDKDKKITGSKRKRDFDDQIAQISMETNPPFKKPNIPDPPPPGPPGPPDDDDDDYDDDDDFIDGLDDAADDIAGFRMMRVEPVLGDNLRGGRTGFREEGTSFNPTQTQQFQQIKRKALADLTLAEIEALNNAKLELPDTLRRRLSIYNANIKSGIQDPYDNPFSKFGRYKARADAHNRYPIHTTNRLRKRVVAKELAQIAARELYDGPKYDQRAKRRRMLHNPPGLESVPPHNKKIVLKPVMNSVLGTVDLRYGDPSNYFPTNKGALTGKPYDIFNRSDRQFRNAGIRNYLRYTNHPESMESFNKLERDARTFVDFERQVPPA